jgi:hypothetical protein
MVYKKILTISITLLILGCSNQKSNNTAEQGLSDNKIDMSVLSEDQQHSIADYEADTSARIYLLGECAKMVKEEKITPPQCESAAIAEYNTLMLDIKINEQDMGVDPLTKEEKDELKQSIILSNTYKQFP